MIFDGNTFIITNKSYPHANLAQWGNGGRDMGTYEQKIYPSQLWLLEAHPTYADYFYIKNCGKEGYRIGKWGGGDEEVGAYNGQYYDDQLWKFVDAGDGYYRIHNKKYPSAKMAKWGKKDDDWGTYAGPDYDSQLWKLKPRFKSEGVADVLWSCDNREGSQDIAEEITITTGLKSTTSESFSTTVGFKTSIEASIGLGDFSPSASSEFYAETNHSLSTTEEETWQRTTTIKFVAPAGKNYRVLQNTCRFESPLVADNCELRCNYKVEERE
jgi:hypothetical protein